MDLSDDDVARAVEALDEFCAPSMTQFPEPYAPTWGPDPEGLGDRSLRQHLESLHVKPEQRDWVEAMCCLLAFGPLDQGPCRVRPYAMWKIVHLNAAGALAAAFVLSAAGPAAADSSACTHHLSGPQVCVRLECNNFWNTPTAIWTNPPKSVKTRQVTLYVNGRHRRRDRQPGLAT
ncbi:hypothetical protein OG239_02905 [Streptomyces sp. NBC_00868]|uniref:hypothetical protein n=1 Tax=unclassified Streptomyces TaxID=2593676 RepID=UPI003243128D|nr:hypothetical protein OG239_02905 [Streptomyces sp. NBC_00868]